MSSFVIIDASYFIIYRTFALLSFWKRKIENKNKKITELHKDNEFINNFKKTFIKKLKELEQYVKKSKDITYIIAKDCNRNNIWRKSLYSDYKKNRDGKTNDLHIPSFFDIVWRENLFDVLSENNKVFYLEHENLEGDDCAAIATKYILKNCTNLNEILIFTADTDYLQLLQIGKYKNNIRILTLKFENLQTEKNSTGFPIKDLKIKILMGDKSDNIPSVFNRCGKKTAEKYCNNTDKLRNDLQKVNKNGHSYMEQYHLNYKLIAFDAIPDGFCEYIENILSINLPF